MRVVVTGATGFIGFPTANALARRGHTVDAVCRTLPTEAFLAGVTSRLVDLTDPASCDRLLETADAVVHLAWYTAPPDYLHDVQRNLECVGTAVALLSSARRHGARIVLAGTCLEAVDAPDPTAYARAKSSVHLLASTLESALCVHLFSVYGPREDPRRAIPRVLRNVRAGRPAAFGEARYLRDYVHVEDVAEAFALLVESGVTGSIDACSGSPLRLREVLELAADAAGGGTLDFTGESPAGTDFDAVGDPAPLRALGWNARSLHSGLRETASWWASLDSAGAHD